MEGRAPRIIVLALGAGALGGPDALRALLGFAGQNPAVDIGICVFVIGMLTAQLLGVALLARFVRKAPRAGAGVWVRGGEAPRPRAPGTDCLAKMTLMVSVGVAFLVTACFVVVTGGGLMSSARFAFDFARNRPVVAADGFLLLCFTPLLRVLRGAGNAGGASRATETRKICLAALPLAGICLFVAPFVAPGGLDALRHFSAGFLNAFTAVATFAVVGTVLLARFSLRAGNGAGAAPAPATDAARFARLTTQVKSLALVCFTLAYFLLHVGMSGSKSDACSAV